MGSTVSSKMAQFPTDDPDYRIIRRVPSRFLHYYFYIRDLVIGPLSMCIGVSSVSKTTYYLNGHNFIEIELRRPGGSLPQGRQRVPFDFGPEGIAGSRR